MVVSSLYQSNFAVSQCYLSQSGPLSVICVNGAETVPVLPVTPGQPVTQCYLSRSGRGCTLLRCTLTVTIYYLKKVPFKIPDGPFIDGHVSDVQISVITSTRLFVL